MSSISVPLLKHHDTQETFTRTTNGARATLPVPNSTRSFWLYGTPDANPLAREGSTGDLPSDVDICIIGSGITGVSAAYHLAKLFDGHKDIDKPLKAVILEARDFCSGATGRNGGHLSPTRFLDFARLEATYGTDEAKRQHALEKHTAQSLIDIIKNGGLENTVDYVPVDHVAIFLAEQEIEEARADYSTAEAADLDLSGIEWLNKDAMQAEYGTSFAGLRYGGANLWPLKLVSELYKLASTQNPSKFELALHTNTPVTAVGPGSSPERRWKVSTPRGNISCSYVLHATNAYASYLLPHMHGPDGIVPARGQVVALRANATPTKTSWWGNQGFEYWFPRPVEDTEKYPLVILGGGREVAGQNFGYYTTDDSVINPEVGKALRNFLPGIIPGKYEKGREPEMEWAGIMGFTKLGDPFVGPVIDKSRPEELQGQYISAGYSGIGMTRAYACAEVIAGMVFADITKTSWTKPDWLPRHYLTAER
ncbi:FAD dependent oxidoreductase [Collybia nuda]|uniref:FAD dependent oxidoreductase n=1 Tax=Collybia nuda TaxID=64659 RepID=A0A9P5Y5B5_9AGAR|nr:FAD dependent oxidoreductase [Collybia nuda]